jgi:peptidoglycan/xylan/chitin deacetylase (PgdA/CDA1 family)
MSAPPILQTNPVREVIVARALQVSVISALGLGALQLLGGVKLVRRVAPWSIPLTSVALSGYFVATFSPRTRYPGTTLRIRLTGEEAKTSVALTFDDGPDPETTPGLLAALRAADARATFFLVGERAARYPDLVREIARDGHAIGIHGLRHQTMALQNAREIARDLVHAQANIEDAVGNALTTRLLRPPYGFRTWTLARTADRLGWATIAWSFDPRDYDPVTPTALARRLTVGLRAGDIVLLHERPNGPTALALPEILAHCRERGWQCVALKG